MLAETIMKSSKVSRGIISFSIVAIVGLVTYNWAVSPQISYVKAAQQYETLSQDMENKSRIMSNSIRIKNVKREKLHAEIESSSIRIFSIDQSDDFFAQLEKMTTTANCDLVSLVYNQEKIVSLDNENPDSAAVTEKNAQLKIDGQYGAIINFTAALKDHPFTVCVLDLRLGQENKDMGKLSCSMNLKVYITDDKEFLSNE